MKHSIHGAACAAILVAASGAAQASLIDRGGGLIYDTDLNITWLANANYGAGSSYDTDYPDGLMTWQNAMDWAANLSYYDSVRNVTYDDWRLPTTLIPDASCQYQSMSASYGYNCTGSEIGHLFYSELGGVSEQYLEVAHDADYNLFANIKNGYYWSTTEYALDTGYAWYFDAAVGLQFIYDKAQRINFYAWAVRPGDVAAAASTVPVPAAAWLFGSGLLGLIGLARRSH